MENKIRVLISKEDVEARIQALADQISREYEGRILHLVTVLKGGVFITTELAKRLTVPVTMDFLTASSYGSGTVSSGNVKVVQGLRESLMGKDVLLVEDIIDSGNTLKTLKAQLLQQEPASLKLLTLLDKPSRRTVEGLTVDYCGFTVPDEFIVGYGLDYAEKYRNLPYIGILEFEE